MTVEQKCISRCRDKHQNCVDCGVQIFDGVADLILLDENGVEIERKTEWVSGHVE